MLIPKYKNIHKEINLKAGMSGKYKLTAIRPDGTERPLTGWFDNLILDSGLNYKGSYTGSPASGGDFIVACQVGTGTSTPTTTQTSLDNRVMGTTSTASTSSGAQGTAPYYGYYIKTYRFAAAVTNYNLTEVGVGSASTGGTLVSRALILDGVGAPTTVTLLTGEILDVSYELRLYPGLVAGDYTQSGININGTSTTIVSRAASVTSSTWGNYIVYGMSSTASFNCTLYSGSLGAITTIPSGTSYGLSAADSIGSYSAGSYSQSATFVAGLTEANPVGGITAASITTAVGVYQYSFSPAIMKDNTMTLSLTFNFSWARV